jgi:hypothetical protein
MGINLMFDIAASPVQVKSFRLEYRLQDVPGLMSEIGSRIGEVVEYESGDALHL